jgi:hypothetical protein
MSLALLVAVLQATTVDGQDVTAVWPPSPSPAAPPNTTVTTYHLFQPKYTGLADKDAGDFLGDASFILFTFTPLEKDNPEASIQHNIMEMSTVTVKGWSTEYLECNAPGAIYNSSHQKFMNCPSDSTNYCCAGNSTAVTADTLPGYKSDRYLTGGGYWYSFPKASEGNTWTEKVERRIKGSCVGSAWRKDAGGCPECGADLDQCVAKCIETARVDLRPSWDKAFSDKTFCPDQPFPGEASAIIV